MQAASSNATLTDVELRTQEYWALSRQWGGVDPATIPTYLALDFTVTTVQMLNPTRPLFRAVRRLHQELISGNGTQLQEPAAVLPWRARHA